MDQRTAEMIGTHNVFAGLWHNLSSFTDSVPCQATRKILLSILHAVRKSARIIRERVPAELRSRLYTPWLGSYEEPVERHLDTQLSRKQALWVRDVLLEVFRIVGDLHDAVHGMWLRDRTAEAHRRVYNAIEAYEPIYEGAIYV